MEFGFIRMQYDEGNYRKTKVLITTTETDCNKQPTKTELIYNSIFSSSSVISA